MLIVQYRVSIQIKALAMKRSFREDWTLLPFLVITLTSFIVAILDFIFLQNLKVQIFALVGLPMLLTGGYLRMRARVQLKKKAGFSSLAATGKLQIVEDHKLVEDGLYKHVRHPIYLGETVRNLGIVLLFSSIYGLVLIAAATVFLLFRMQKEEKMLTERFGKEYQEYQRKTKRIIPYIY